MKQLFILLIAAAGLTQCSKSDQSKSSQTLEGSWELRQIWGGLVMAGQPLNYPPGNGNRLVFNNGNYQIYIQQVLAQSGTYTLIPETSFVDNRVLNRLQLSQDTTQLIYTELLNNQLVLYKGTIIALDGIEEYYDPY